MNIGSIAKQDQQGLARKTEKTALSKPVAYVLLLACGFIFLLSQSVAAQTPPCSSTVSIGYGQTVSGGIGATSENDCFQFSARVGEQVSIMVIEAPPVTAGFNACWQLFGPGGQVVTSDCDQGQSGPLPADGVYTLVISDDFFSQQQGDYDISLTGDCQPPDMVCTSDAQCSDSLFCNGSETCQSGTCVPGTLPCPSDGQFCNGTESCNETTDSCVLGTPSCPDDGLFCNGAESCNETTNTCMPGTPPCPAEVCNESTNMCPPSGGPVVSVESICGTLGGRVTLPVNLNKNGQPVGSVGFTLTFPTDKLCVGNPLMDVTCSPTAAALGFSCTAQADCPAGTIQGVITPPVMIPVPELPQGEIARIIFGVKPTAPTGTEQTCSVQASERMPLSFSNVDCGNTAGQALACTSQNGCVDVLPCVQGDCNASGGVTTADVTCTILRLFDEIPQASACEDCNGDGQLTTADVICTILCRFGQCPPRP